MALQKIQSKVFNDSIHGHIELHPLLVKIIDTPQFQRLRYIKQLGGGYFVYPGACHNRFEHSIGVAHLAGELVEALSSRQPYLNIDDRDILCVKIAGLCHDLGHGPFSHLYDGMFIPKAIKEGGKKSKHEIASCDMFDYLIEKNKLLEEMKKAELKLEKDLPFIKEMIIGGPLKEQAKEWPFEGREKEKAFLYEIVANKTTEIDVDKFDYFARDCHHLGIRNNFDHQRYIQFAMVCEVDGKLQICTRDKEEDNLYEMFHTRMNLHRRAYQHKTNKIIEVMITEAFIQADPYIRIEGSGEDPEKKLYSLSTAKDDMVAYTKLTDHVFEEILYSSSKELEGAREILQKIVSRNIYKFVGQKHTENKDIDEEKIREDLANAGADSSEKLTSDDFVVAVAHLDFGMKDKNPIEEMYFYKKEQMETQDEKCPKAEKIPKDQVSKLRPTVFSEKIIRVYCKKTEDSIVEAARKHFANWMHKRGPAKEAQDPPSKKKQRKTNE